MAKVSAAGTLNARVIFAGFAGDSTQKKLINNLGKGISSEANRIPMPQRDIDVYSAWNAANHQFVVPNDGLYGIFGFAKTNHGANDVHRVKIILNNVVIGNPPVVGNESLSSSAAALDFYAHLLSTNKSKKSWGKRTADISGNKLTMQDLGVPTPAANVNGAKSQRFAQYVKGYRPAGSNLFGVERNLTPLYRWLSKGDLLQLSLFGRSRQGKQQTKGKTGAYIWELKVKGYVVADHTGFIITEVETA